MLPVWEAVGARRATAGEFTLRALRNGKMDALQTRSWAEMVVGSMRSMLSEMPGIANAWCKGFDARGAWHLLGCAIGGCRPCAAP